ncbi:pyridoxal 5'-phosphate synthase [Leifsonia lichenia]
MVGVAPPWEPESAPDEPHALFLSWLTEAIDAELPEPHAATLSTVDEDGLPDARVLVLKDVTDDGGFSIATAAESAKGAQLARNPGCALSFYWGPLARAVRIRGIARRATAAASAADFLARHPAARAQVLAGRQSSVLVDSAGRDRLIADAQAAVDGDPGLVAAQWTAWTIEPSSVEFWQGSPDRNHQRLQYLRTASTWTRRRLWP